MWYLNQKMKLEAKPYYLILLSGSVNLQLVPWLPCGSTPSAAVSFHIGWIQPPEWYYSHILSSLFLSGSVNLRYKYNFHFLTNIGFRQMRRWNGVKVSHQWIARKPGNGQGKGINHMKLHGYISLWVNFQVSKVKIVDTGALSIFMPRPGIAAEPN